MVPALSGFNKESSHGAKVMLPEKKDWRFPNLWDPEGTEFGLVGDLLERDFKGQSLSESEQAFLLRRSELSISDWMFAYGYSGEIVRHAIRWQFYYWHNKQRELAATNPDDLQYYWGARPAMYAWSTMLGDEQLWKLTESLVAELRSISISPVDAKIGFVHRLSLHIPGRLELSDAQDLAKEAWTTEQARYALLVLGDAKAYRETIAATFYEIMGTLDQRRKMKRSKEPRGRLRTGVHPSKLANIGWTAELIYAQSLGITVDIDDPALPVTFFS